MTAKPLLLQLPLPHKLLISGCIGLIGWALLHNPGLKKAEQQFSALPTNIFTYNSLQPLNQIFSAISSYQPFANDDLVEWFNTTPNNLELNDDIQAYHQLYNFSDNLAEPLDDTPSFLVTDTGVDVDASLLEDEPHADPDQLLRQQQLRIRRGDTLAQLLVRAGLEINSLPQLKKLPEARVLNQLKAGQSIEIISKQQQLVELHYDYSATETLHVLLTGDRLSAQIEQHPLENKVQLIRGQIRSSLYADGIKAGMSQKMVHQLTKIFGWDIDFTQDIQPGDQFNVVTEENWAKGKRLGGGNILAAEFITGGQKFRAFRYVDADGNSNFFNEKGETMRKAFLQAPVDVERITSGFNLRRMHPVLHKIMAHRGIDYAGRVGTPVKAAGDARVESAGFQSTFGNLVVLRHGPRYQTKYAHLSRFARGLKVGQKIRQGEVIGYIGATGRVTGAHLHYEFLVNGTHQNPKSLKLNLAQPLTGKERSRYLAQIRPLVQQLDKGTSLALNDR